MKEQIEKYEDRYGSPDFESGKGANTEKLVSRKEIVQMKKLGIKPTDTLVDKIKKIIAEEKPNLKRKENDEAIEYLKSKGMSDEEIEQLMQKPVKDNAEQEPENSEENDEEESEKNLFDPEEEKRITIMQSLNPRVLKQKEKKEYMTRTNVQEEIVARLNEITSHKLNLFKTAIALNLPFEINERIKENKVKKDNVVRQIGANAYIQNVRKSMQSPKITGREVINDPNVESKKVSDLYHNLSNPAAQSAEDLRQQHYTLHEETEQLDEANKNVIKQGRTKVVKARVRGGKVQRRKRVSAVKGYTIRGGKLKRMSMQERIRRKRGQKRGKVKRRAKMARALMKRKRSMRKRASLGLKE